MKRNLQCCALFFLLSVCLLLRPDSIQAQVPPSVQQQSAGIQTSSTLTLTDVINLALDANRGLISSAYGVESQSLSVDVARSEFEWKLFPQATAGVTDESRSFGGGVTIEKKLTSGPVASMSPEILRMVDGNNGEDYSTQVGISLTAPLLRGFGKNINLDGVRSAQYALRRSERSHYLVKVNTVLEAVTAAYSVIQQRELVGLQQRLAERFEGHAVMAKSREKIGLATPIDVYRAQIRLKDAQERVNRAQEALRSAGDRLKIVLAAPLDQVVNVVAPLDYTPVDIDVGQAIETALDHRMELKQADDDIAEAKRSSLLSKHNLLPQLDLVANYTRLENDDTLDSSNGLTEEFWSINLVSTTDWSRSAERATYKQSLLAVKRARLSRTTQVESIKREVRQFYDALQKAQGRMHIRNEQIQQARGKLALAKIKFAHGMANNFDLIEAETELQEARTNLLSAQIEYIVGTYRLRAALGTLIES